jgi:hypothetical protein
MTCSSNSRCSEEFNARKFCATLGPAKKRELTAVIDRFTATDDTLLQAPPVQDQEKIVYDAMRNTGERIPC